MMNSRRFSFSLLSLLLLMSLASTLAATIVSSTDQVANRDNKENILSQRDISVSGKVHDDAPDSKVTSPDSNIHFNLEIEEDNENSLIETSLRSSSDDKTDVKLLLIDENHSSLAGKSIKNGNHVADAEFNNDFEPEGSQKPNTAGSSSIAREARGEETRTRKKREAINPTKPPDKNLNQKNVDSREVNKKAQTTELESKSAPAKGVQLDRSKQSSPNDKSGAKPNTVNIYNDKGSKTEKKPVLETKNDGKGKAAVTKNDNKPLTKGNSVAQKPAASITNVKTQNSKKEANELNKANVTSNKDANKKQENKAVTSKEKNPKSEDTSTKKDAEKRPDSSKTKASLSKAATSKTKTDANSPTAANDLRADKSSKQPGKTRPRNASINSANSAKQSNKDAKSADAKSAAILPVLPSKSKGQPNNSKNGTVKAGLKSDNKTLDNANATLINSSRSGNLTVHSNTTSNISDPLKTVDNSTLSTATNNSSYSTFDNSTGKNVSTIKDGEIGVKQNLKPKEKIKPTTIIEKGGSPMSRLSDKPEAKKSETDIKKSIAQPINSTAIKTPIPPPQGKLTPVKKTEAPPSPQTSEKIPSVSVGRKPAVVVPPKQGKTIPGSYRAGLIIAIVLGTSAFITAIVFIINSMMEYYKKRGYSSLDNYNEFNF